MKTTVDEITIEIQGKKVSFYPEYNSDDVIQSTTFNTQTEAIEFYFAQVEDL